MKSGQSLKHRKQLTVYLFNNLVRKSRLNTDFSQESQGYYKINQDTLLSVEILEHKLSAHTDSIPT